MPLDTAAVRQHLKSFDFEDLFTQELGWEHLTMRPQSIEVGDHTYTLTPVTHKRGVQIFECSPDADGNIPDYPTRQKIEKKVRQLAHEHLIIFTDAARATQIWQWVYRAPGKTTAYREHTYRASQPGDALIQKLENIVFPLSEEEGFTLSDTLVKLKDAFDKERVTRRFYDRFKTEHTAFLGFIEGIQSQADREWYASLMLNRLMFVYFIQRKGFLDGNTNYLPSRLKRLRAAHVGERFFSFYRHFLLRLFHEGLGSHHHTPELDALLGKVPFLNGGLFELHQLEQDYPEIHIPDDAFERIFTFFNEYDWYLDDRPLSKEKEINPDVLGYIFEKYINQKQMGAYYTKEDITGYISQNTVIPFLFDAAHPNCRIAFEGNPSIWDLLQTEPDRYIYDAVKKGVSLPLPPEIEAGVADVSKRGGWNRPAPEQYALPTEIWREVVARRERYEQVWLKLVNGEIRDINDLITYNLNIRQFAQDVVQNCEGPELLRAFWGACRSVKVLDPTCGSGAFLFAAVNILEPLYEACLDRMQAFVDDLDRSPLPHRPEKFSDFRDTLARVSGHPNRDYFILKSIILNNLYGVDIMEEAVEICKLRLFLKLVAQVESAEQVEPLPDIDFNIRAGNTLVGFATYEDLQRVFVTRMDLDNAQARVKESAEIAARKFESFRLQQTKLGGAVTPQDKADLRAGLKKLNDELDRYLAIEYGIDPANEPAFDKWRASHQPFHWFVEFYGIMVDRGGFDVIIGNPPYVEYTKVKSDYRVLNYQTEECGNLFAFMLERSSVLLNEAGYLGMIVPMSVISTEKMSEVRQHLSCVMSSVHLSHYSGDAHPSVLFNGVKMRLSIVLTKRGRTAEAEAEMFSTSFVRWYSEARPQLFQTIIYRSLPSYLYLDGIIPKIGSGVDLGVLDKVFSQPRRLGYFEVPDVTYAVYAHRIVAHFVKCFDFVPYFRNDRDGVKRSEDYKVFSFRSQQVALVMSAILNSTTFYYFYLSYSDAYHCGRDLILLFPFDITSLVDGTTQQLLSLNARLMQDFRDNSVRRKIQYKNTGWIEYDEFYPRKSKMLIDEIDRVLAQHYGFTEEELDFIINYDIKYRMGRDSEGEGEGEGSEG